MLAGGAELELGCQEEGRGPVANPYLKSYLSAARARIARRRQRQALWKPERPTSTGVATGPKGGATGGPSHLFLIPLKAVNCLSISVS